MVKQFTTLVFLFIAIGTLAYAKEQQKEISIDFRVFGVGRDHFEELYFFNGKEIEPLEFLRTSRSISTYQYRGSPELNIYFKNPNYIAEDENNPPYLLATSAQIDPSISQGLVIFAANSSNRDVQIHERTYELFIINDAPESFARNSLLLVNTTGVPLFGKAGSTDIDIQPGAIASVDFSDYAGSDKGIPIGLAFEAKNGPRLVLSNDIRIATNRRVVLILERPKRPNSTRLEIRMLSEAIYPKETASE